MLGKGAGMSVRDQVYRIVAEQAVLEVSDVSDDKTLDELGIDSLGLVESIFAIEEAFDISSVGAIVRAVEGLLAGQRTVAPE